jgi:uncharacterized protein YggE
MLRPLLFAAVLLAQAAPALPPLAPRAPMPMPMPAAAGPADGISVMGTGSASAQATDAQVSLRVSARNNALTLNAQTLQPIVDALVRAGVERSSITLPMYLVGQAHTNNAVIVASVRHPTLQMLQQGMTTIADAFAANPDILLNAADVRLSADNCTALQRTAAANAIASARANAAFVARQIGRRVGAVLAVDVRMPMSTQEACYYSYSVGPFGAMYPQQSPADMLTVRTVTSVMMRFAILP